MCCALAKFAGLAHSRAYSVLCVRHRAHQRGDDSVVTQAKMFQHLVCLFHSKVTELSWSFPNCNRNRSLAFGWVFRV